MGRKRYSPEEIISKLREAEVLLAQGRKADEVSRALGVTEQTYYRWRREYIWVTYATMLNASFWLLNAT